MVSSSQYINDSVFTTNLKIQQKQNETKELFFKCLDEGRDYDYFKKKLEKIWNNLDYSFLQEQLMEYEEIIHTQNIEGKKVTEVVPEEKGISPLFTLVPLTLILKQEERLIRTKLREYKNSINSYAYKNDKEEYLKLKIQKYTSQIVPYYSHTEDKKIRYVELSTYSSMIQNTNLTRTAWNTTLKDSFNLGYEKFYIPYHSFSCPHCVEHQNIIYSRNQIMDLVDDINEAEKEGSQAGDILHPNCKCILVMLKDGESITITNTLSNEEKEDIYKIRQKVNSLTLKKEEILTDMKISKQIGNMEMYDEYNKQRNKINKDIRELRNELPTEELRKQVVAIKR